MVKVIVVAGANGALGELVCKNVLQLDGKHQDSIRVRALIRSSSSNKSTEGLEALSKTYPKTLQILPIDYSSESDLNKACSDAFTVVSCLQGLDEVIVVTQSRLLQAAIACKVHRFIPSDYAANFTKLPKGHNRNFDVRIKFHDAASKIIRSSEYKIEFTSIYQGGFMNIIEEAQLIDFDNNLITYIGSPDTVYDWTTWENTAEYVARVAVDSNPMPNALCIAGDQVTPYDLQRIASEVTGKKFGLKQALSLCMYEIVISLVKLFSPGKKGDLLPLWQKMQYGLSMALGTSSSLMLDNHFYKDIQWTKTDVQIKQSYENYKKKEKPKKKSNSVLWIGLFAGAAAIACAAWYIKVKA